MQSRRRLTAFLCTAFGGPVESVPQCSYTDASTGRQVVNASDMWSAMWRSHRGKGLSISREQNERFVDMLVSAVRSVVDITDDAAASMSLLLLQYHDSVVSPSAHGCPKSGITTQWQGNGSESWVVRVGESVTWVWGDSEPHSIRSAWIPRDTELFDSSTSEASRADGDEGEEGGAAPLFQGFGSGRLAVSSETLCSPLNVGKYDDNDVPRPCNLQTSYDPTTPTFAYTVVFDKVGVHKYTGGYPTDIALQGTVTVGPQDGIGNGGADSWLAWECAPGCTLGQLVDVRCDAACLVPDCVFDGGDCACSGALQGGMGQCSCPSSQTRRDDGGCCTESAVGSDLIFPFKLREFSDNLTHSAGALATPVDIPLARYVSARNRVMMGLMLTQTRASSVPCQGKNFSGSMGISCVGPPSSEPFGVNPKFLPSSSLYDPNAIQILDSAEGQLAVDLVRNAQGNPYGFIPLMPVQRKQFAVVFDINLAQSAAINRLQYLIDGHFIDNHTTQVNVRLITYDADVRKFATVFVDCKVRLEGAIDVTFDIFPVAVEPYSVNKWPTWLQVTLEVLYLLAVLWNVWEEVHEVYQTWQHTGSALNYFRNLWNILDDCSIALQLACIIMWIQLTFVLQWNFNMEPRYDIYYSLQEFPRYWAMPSPPTGYNAALKALQGLENILNQVNIYNALQGINLFLVTLRLLKLMDFQPYMGIITRSLSAALPSLIHFFLLWFMVFFSFAMFGYLVFGRVMEQFETLSRAMETCFLIIANDNGVEYYFMQMGGWMYAASVIWWIAFVVIMVFILLNFLIAIIVDAFVDVKDMALEATTMYFDLWRICVRFWKRVGSPYLRYSHLKHHLQYLGLHPRDRSLSKVSTLRRGGVLSFLYKCFGRQSNEKSSTVHEAAEGRQRHDVEAIGSGRSFAAAGDVVASAEMDSGSRSKTDSTVRWLRPPKVHKERVLKVGDCQLDRNQLQAVLERSYHRQLHMRPASKSIDPAVLSEVVIRQFGDKVVRSQLPRKPTDAPAHARNKEIAQLKETVQRLEDKLDRGLEEMKQLVLMSLSLRRQADQTDEQRAKSEAHLQSQDGGSVMDDGQTPSQGDNSQLQI